MKEKKLVLAIIAVLALIFISANSVFATAGNLIVIQGNNTSANNTATEGNTVANNVVNNVVANNTANTVNKVNSVNTLNTTNTSKSVYNNTTALPKTGSNDYAVFAIIGICAISAVYAYKKIRDYNI